ncbi:hypothetical protein [Kineococcus radiotolerans]|uniref:Uncharacterized protein n=1 Tax=Kineococcus radiotolerans (strain ATCC BAA-149 / DSM 14245 / SRS30216) TaxID=266940 RepID=A6WH40_KINRD|nr:hypothetical protein [Kineococcus radiotolerans]ABS06129.1 hypothetical protein Krad_4671 [Kineococcus radiotolerans SRS30216 = ATCC BAA-149]
MSTETPIPRAAILASAGDAVAAAAAVQEAEYGRCEIPDDLESMTCVCGTDIGRGDGFANSDTNAVEMDHGWDGKHFACQRCGRVFDQSQHDEASGLVLVVAGPQEFTPLAEQG